VPVDWSVWQLDRFTVGWIVWLLFFIVWESWALSQGYRGTLTAHLRPVFLAWPLSWWLAFGAWLWIGVHMLAPAIERGLLDLARGG